MSSSFNSYFNPCWTGLVEYKASSTSITPITSNSIIGNKKEGRYLDLSIANWFLKKEEMSFAKMSILCFYAQAWNYVKRNFKLMMSDFYAGNEYPLSKSLELFFNDKKIKFSKNIILLFDADTLELLESVWETYGDLSTNALITLVEQEPPYKKTLKKDIISREKMIEFYSSIAL